MCVTYHNQISKIFSALKHSFVKIGMMSTNRKEEPLERQQVFAIRIKTLES